MKPISKEFTEKGFRHTMVFRVGNVAIYERQGAHHSKPHWEVVIIRFHNGFKAFGKTIPPSEFYPGPTQWGVFGFTCNSLSDAEKKAAMLTSHKSPQSNSV